MMDNYGEKSRELFLNKKLLADVCFEIITSEEDDEDEEDSNDKMEMRSSRIISKKQTNSTLVYAHKAVLAARCDFFARMFQSNFSEASSTKPIRIGDIPTIGVFMSFIEYLYSDHCAGLDFNPRATSIMEISNRFGITRLVSLCELYMSFQIDKAVAKSMAKADIDLIGLLLLSQQHNASQLSKFLLHFISNNYEPMSKRSEFTLLQGKNLEYINEHRWPPLSYLDEVAKYEKAVKGTDNESKCNVM